MSNISLIKSVIPYFNRYRNILFIDLLCAGLTTASEMILPLILRYLTNVGIADPGSLTINLIVRIAVIFVLIKCVELVAVYYMASIGLTMKPR